MVILILFNSLAIETISITEENVSLERFKHLQDLYSNSIICPCSNIFVLYSELISFSPRLHHVCSSDFIRDEWIQLIALSWGTFQFPIDSQYFRLLAQICKLSRNTIDDAIRRLLARSFVNVNLLIEPNFNAQLNATIKQFIQTLIINFNLFIDIVQLSVQVDQLLSALTATTDLRSSLSTNSSLVHQIPQVNYC